VGAESKPRTLTPVLPFPFSLQVLDVSKTMFDERQHDPAYYIAKTPAGKTVVVVRGTKTYGDVLTDCRVRRVHFLTGKLAFCVARLL
jgi:hypothetical protein